MKTAVTAAAASVGFKQSPRPHSPALHIVSSSDDNSAAFPLFNAPISPPIFGQTIMSRERDCPTIDIDARMHSQAAPAELRASVIGPLPQSLSSHATRNLIDTTVPPRSKGIPKRKSLSGLFGSPITTKNAGMRSLSADPFPITCLSDKTTVQQRPLSTTSDDARPASFLHQSFPPYQDWLDQEIRSEKHPDDDERTDLPDVLADRFSGDLRFVKSANQELSTLLSSFGDSPASVAQESVSPCRVLAASNSLSSLPHNPDSSPTPMRRIQSAMLTGKTGSSPCKETGPHMSPIKIALHRAQLANDALSRTTSSSLQDHNSVKDLRTMMASVTLARQAESPEPKPSMSGRVAFGKIRSIHTLNADKQGPRLAEKFGPDSLDHRHNYPKTVQVVPDQSVLRVNIDSLKLSGETATPLLHMSNAPVLQNRSLSSPLGTAGRPPTLSLPPTPENPAHSKVDGTDSSWSPSKYLGTRSDVWSHNPAHQEKSRPDVHELRRSFDFSNEYAKLVRGARRASFLEALQKVGFSNFLEVDNENHGSWADLTLPLLLQVALPDQSCGECLLIRQSPNNKVGDASFDPACVQNHRSSHSKVCADPIQKLNPFEGQVAFQECMSRAKERHGQAFSQSAPPCDVAYLAEIRNCRQSHRRSESGLSIATMSSFGAVIDSRIADEHINFLDTSFTDHLIRKSTMPAEQVNELPDACDTSFAGYRQPWVG